MWNTFKYTILSLMREKSILIWGLAFPLILASLFNVMFSGIDDAVSFKIIPVGIVENENYEDTPAFKEMIEQLGKTGNDQTIEPHYLDTSDEAKTLLDAGTITGYYEVDEEGTPKLTIATSNNPTVAAIDETILKTVLDDYIRTSHTFETILVENPAVPADENLVERLYDRKSHTEEIPIFANEASGSIRYFYALLGFAAIMVAMVGMTATVRTQGNLSALGARRMVGATSQTKTLISTLSATWLLSFACLLIAFVFMRFVLAIDFGGREVACVLGLLVSSLMTTSLGTLVGSIPKLGEGAKGGLLSGLSCILALFAGLYGTSSQRLADDLAKSAPLLQTLNPAKQVTDLFYSLYYYDGFDQFLTGIVVLLVLSAIFLLIAGIFLRRRRYASL